MKKKIIITLSIIILLVIIGIIVSLLVINNNKEDILQEPVNDTPQVIEEEPTEEEPYVSDFEFVDYKEAIKYSNEKTFIYFDPPYRPLNITSGFTSYTKDDFDGDDQKELAKFYRELNNTNAKLMLSNSNPKNTNINDTFFDDIYNGFNINEVYANRCINSKASKRGAISELLITNYGDKNV